jgi:hypothetical protein
VGQLYALPYLAFMRLHRLALDARRRDRSWRYYLYSAAAGVLAAILAVVALVSAWALWTTVWWPLSIFMFVLFVTPPLQPVLSRRIFVPLGMVRTAFWAGHFVTMDDSDAYGLCCAAWAHSRKPTPKGEAWITTRRDKRIPLGDSEIVVTALLVAARGDAETARQLMRSTAFMVENHPLVRELAGEWLAVDAAHRRAWAELHGDAVSARWPASALTFFLEGVAALRVDAKTQPGALELRARWLLAPHRTVTRRLLAEPAVAPPRSAAIEATDARTPPDPSTLPRAVAAHLEISQSRMPTVAEFAETVTAWDAALVDGETQKWLARRALELDAPLGAVDRAIKEVAQAVTDDLARLADAGGLGAPQAHGPVGDALARRLRHGRLDALESGFNRWEQRRHTGSLRSPIDEWREFVALRASYEAAVAAGGLELRRLAFPHAYSKGSSMAVWLWNQRNEYAVSHAISAWLREEAMTVGDTEAIELTTRNCKLNVPTRTGDVRGV